MFGVFPKPDRRPLDCDLQKAVALAIEASVPPASVDVSKLALASLVRQIVRIGAHKGYTSIGANDSGMSELLRDAAISLLAISSDNNVDLIRELSLWAEDENKRLPLLNMSRGE